MTTRVRVADYGTLAADDARLVRVPSVRGRTCRLHWAAAQALAKLSYAWRESTLEIVGDIRIASGWRAHRWSSRGAYVGKGDGASERRHRETIWFSPGCLPIDLAHADAQGTPMLFEATA